MRTIKHLGTGTLIFSVHIDVTIKRKVESKVISVNDVLINLRHSNEFSGGFSRGWGLRGWHDLCCLAFPTSSWVRFPL